MQDGPKIRITIEVTEEGIEVVEAESEDTGRPATKSPRRDRCYRPGDAEWDEPLHGEKDYSDVYLMYS